MHLEGCVGRQCRKLCEEIWVVLDDGGHSPASNRDATVASRPKTKPKDGEGSGEDEDPEQAKLQVGLNSAIVREKPNVKLNDITRLSPLDQAPDPSTLETFLGRVPMVFNVVIISPHGYFGQANVLGLLDTSGQDVANEIAAELQGYPDFIIGNYNDGNLVTSLLAYKIGVAQHPHSWGLSKLLKVFMTVGGKLLNGRLVCYDYGP
ncbi:hypothetical protein JHK82_027460 [Glycine max]|uniref:sucrose synthase n=1 Tax=Glycine soja TaxID=3848 RepID=A0A445IKB5_GLYSO|nr:hypothetical protein JHK82_027460 [Glycine max]RZB86489.1 Sucrose synthase 4 [Glycine soja]